MSEIVDAVKDGLRTALAKRPGWSQQGSYVVNNAVFTDISPRDLEALARAAIEAYEAAKKKAEEPYVTRVEKGVTYWSNGLCSQEMPKHLKDFIDEQVKLSVEAMK